jgi:NTE family protein
MNYNSKNKLNNPLQGFITTSMDLWQQSARAWIESYKEVVVSSQKIHNSWLDTICATLGTRQDQSTENPSTPHDNAYNNKKKVRALILQGGGTLGAYQAGAFKALYEKLTKEDIQSGNRGRPLFDIVAGTSIGAINAAILVSHVLENKTWAGSAEKLIEFWEYLSCPTPDITKNSAIWKKEFDKKTTGVASAEAARRYYSVKEFLKSGVDKAYSPILPPREDKKFFDPQNKKLLYDKKPLQKSLEKFAKFPIATSYEKGQPRLLVVSTDVIEGKAVTFDSYEKGKDLNEKEIRQTVYEGYNQERIVIEYNEGINMQHVMASASLPEFYDYEKINGREFWDGGILSNTPIRELIQAHKEFWECTISSKELKNSILNEANFVVPDLELYLINLWHSYDNNSIPSDPDGISERHMDIKLHDQYYVNESILITHYIHLIKKLLQLKNNKEYELKSKINEILEDYTISRYATEKPNKYLDLIKTQFEIAKLEIIERRDDIHTIAGKGGDFTSETIKKLIKEGYESTWKEYCQFVSSAA